MRPYSSPITHDFRYVFPPLTTPVSEAPSRRTCAPPGLTTLKPWTVRHMQELMPDGDIIEFICQENNHFTPR